MYNEVFAIYDSRSEELPKPVDIFQSISLLARRASQRRSNLCWCAKVWRTVRVPVDNLSHGVPVAIACAGTVGSRMKDVPNLCVVGALEEAAV